MTLISKLPVAPSISNYSARSLRITATHQLLAAAISPPVSAAVWQNPSTGTNAIGNNAASAAKMLLIIDITTQLIKTTNIVMSRKMIRIFKLFFRKEASHVIKHVNH